MMRAARVNTIVVSVVVPAFNEEDNIPALAERLEKVLRDYPYEILFIDDGSVDGTLARIKQLRKSNRSIHFISLSRNFGHQNALKAGLDAAGGECIITLDADLQHPPELIPEMIRKWREDYQVVFTVREDNGTESRMKRLTARAFYKLVNLISEVRIQEGAADFRLLDRSVVEVLRKIDEPPFYRGIVPWMGFRQIGIPFAPLERHSGTSKYSFARMLRLALSGLVSFSVVPLRLATILGFVMAVSGFIVGMKAIIEYLVSHDTVPGWASTIASIAFVGGVQLIIMGIIGEYLGRLFIESKKRPHYIVRESSRDGCGK